MYKQLCWETQTTQIKSSQSAARREKRGSAEPNEGRTGVSVLSTLGSRHHAPDSVGGSHTLTWHTQLLPKGIISGGLLIAEDSQESQHELLSPRGKAIVPPLGEQSQVSRGLLKPKRNSRNKEGKVSGPASLRLLFLPIALPAIRSWQASRSFILKVRQGGGGWGSRS